MQNKFPKKLTKNKIIIDYTVKYNIIAVILGRIN